MARPSLHSFGLGLLVILFLSSCVSATTASNWTNPNARLPDFSSTYLVGEKIYLSWQPLNQSTNDLWLTRYDLSNNYTLRIARTLDISQAGSVLWTVAVPETEVENDTRFALVFVPVNSNYEGTSDSDSGFESPAFNLMVVNQATPPNGTVSASTSTAQLSSTSVTAEISATEHPPTPSLDVDHSSGLATGTIAGITVGALVVVGLVCLLAGFLVFKKRKSRHTHTLPADSDVPVKGPYEVLGNNKAPSELSSKETQVHEMTCSQETLANESDGTPVHEIGNTVKRPGLHEMPG